MNTIEKTLKLLLTSEMRWFGILTAFPSKCKNVNRQDFTFYKELNNYDDCKSGRSYNVIKSLLQSQGIRSIHPAWFFIHRKSFEKDNFIFEEDTFNDFDTLNLVIPKEFHIPHKIQITSTLNMYYTILLNLKINECLINPNSKFTKKYPEFKEISKYLYFPIVENKSDRKYIDLTYDFDNIIDNINIEINEPHHKIVNDNNRATEIYYNSGNRIIQHYINKDTIFDFMPKFFFRLTSGIFNRNIYAGLVFNAFITDIINNLSIAIFFSDLKKTCLENKLTWELFLEKCKLVDIIINSNFISIIENELKHIKDPEERKEKLNRMFYNYTGLNNKTLLKETGYDFYLMSINSENSVDSLDIKHMYSMYRQEYEKVMTVLLTNEREEKDMIKSYSKSIIDKLNGFIKSLKSQ